MTASPVYTEFLNDQNEVIKRLNKKNSRFFSNLNVFLSLFIAKRKIKALNKDLLKQLMALKGLLVSFREDNTLPGSDRIPALLEKLGALNEQYIKLHHKAGLAKTDSPLPVSKDWETCDTILLETIDTLYAAIRFLNKVNVVPPVETSELAQSIAHHSAKNLQKIIYGR